MKHFLIEEALIWWLWTSKGTIHKPCGQFFWTFLTLLPLIWTILLNKVYVVIWTFGYPSPFHVHMIYGCPQDTTSLLEVGRFKSRLIFCLVVLLFIPTFWNAGIVTIEFVIISNFKSQLTIEASILNLCKKVILINISIPCFHELKSISFNLELRISVPQKNAPSLSPWIL